MNTIQDAVCLIQDTILRLEKERDALQERLNAVQDALGNGADDAVWVPGLTIPEAVAFLRDSFHAPRPETLEQARVRTQAAVQEGIICPCCDRFAKQYRRALHSEMGQFLIMLYRADNNGTEWVHIRDILGGGGKAATDASYLVYYQLLERRGDNESAGWYKTTDLGRSFVEGKQMARSHFFVYGGECKGFDGEYVTIHDVLGVQFKYADLMAGL